MCSPRRSAADACRAGLVAMRRAVVADRLDHLSVRPSLADGPGDRMRDDARIDTGTGDHAGMRVPIGFGRVEVARRRHPRGPLEDVGKRTDCIDIYVVVGFRQVYDEPWRRLLKGGLDSRERSLV